MTTISSKIRAVGAALQKQPPFCTGLVTIDGQSSTLFYKKEGKAAAFLSLASADVEDLQGLTDACLPAKFGLGNRDVYDESYRKAKKMDTSNFTIGFDPSPIVDIIRQELLDGERGDSPLDLELYQLNVYDKGSFFKAHRDTPRNSKMFASLVVVFPAAHEGGKLLLRHDGEEWTFDAAEILSATTSPSAAFVAFYSDVEHEVTLVESGYRVTLTYNVYLGGKDTKASAKVIPKVHSNRKPDTSLLRTTIATLLQDPECLPRGGYFGFGLRFKYPTSGSSILGQYTYFDEILTQLKGSDNVIYQVCTSLSLKTSLQILTTLEGDTVLLPYAQDLSGQQVESLANELWDVTKIHDWSGLSRPESDSDSDSDGSNDDINGSDGELNSGPDDSEESSDDSAGIGSTDSDHEADDLDEDSSKPIIWLSPATAYVGYETSYIVYGNEASVDTLYGDVCLVAEVGSANKRETAK